MEHTLSAGTIIDGRYEILSVAGSGGMSTVFRAKHLDLERLVAIKTLDPLLVSDPELFERFKREARVLSELKHPHICMFYSYGVLPSKLPYIAMEYLEGQTLASLLNDGAIPAKRAIQLCLQICSAMECAHKAGIIHRDLKPQNIFLLKDPEPDFVKLLDFGLARYETKADQVLTKTGELIGTPEFLSPEQCLGRRADERSDIYALCCVLYKMLTGRSPFESDSPVGFLTKHLKESPVNPREISQNLPVGLELIVLKGMEKDANERQQSMPILAEQLNSILLNKGANLNINISKAMQGTKSSASKLLLAALLIGFTLTAIAVLILANNFSIKSRQRESLTVAQLIMEVKQANQSHDKARSELLMRKLENTARLQGNNPLSKASACCDVAEQLLKYNLKEEATQMAKLALADVNAVSANFSRGNYSALGPVMPLVDKFMDSKVSMKNLDDKGAVAARREEWISGLQKISERSAEVLIKTSYLPSKKVIHQCCHQIEHMRSSGFIFGNTAHLIIRAYKQGQAPLNECLIMAYQDINIENLRKNDTDALLKSSKEAEEAMQKLYGKKSPKIPNHHFNITTDWVSSSDQAAKQQSYARGCWLINHVGYDKSDIGTAKLYLAAGNAADRLGKSEDRTRFYKLAYESLKDEHNVLDKTRVIMQLALDRYHAGDFSLTMKLLKEGHDQLANYPDEDFQRAEYALLKARCLIQLKKVNEALTETEQERQYLKQQLPGSGSRLSVLLGTIAGELLSDKHCFGKKEIAHLYLHEALALEKYLPEHDRMSVISGNIANILKWDSLFGTKENIETDWSMISREPEAAWKNILKEPAFAVNYASLVKAKNLPEISAEFAQKSEGLAKTELLTATPDIELVATALKILQALKEDSRADELNTLALKSIPKEELQQLK